MYHTKNGRTSKRGAFVEGIWHCDCEPRLPAEKFRVKNGGKNHGRWFYTCKKPQPKRCSFFLWSDDAEIREESAVVSNSRPEPNLPIEPTTPKKTAAPVHQPPTPLSEARSKFFSPTLSGKRSWSPNSSKVQDEERFDWSSSGDDELALIAEAVVKGDSESPKKVARTQILDSPGKRIDKEATNLNDPNKVWPHGDDVFATPPAATPTTTTTTKSHGLLSPLQSQKKPFQHDVIPQLSSDLATEVMQLLKPVNLTKQIEQELVELLNRHDLRTQGIIRGRDITRLAVSAKDQKIAELQARINVLEAEKETSRTVIAHLKQDIATSPKRPGRTRFGSRSEV